MHRSLDLLSLSFQSLLRGGGGDPSALIFRAVQFFRYYNIPEEERILNASYHLDDEALIWFQDCERSLDS